MPGNGWVELGDARSITLAGGPLATVPGRECKAVNQPKSTSNPRQEKRGRKLDQSSSRNTRVIRIATEFFHRITPAIGPTALVTSTPLFLNFQHFQRQHSLSQCPTQVTTSTRTWCVFARSKIPVANLVEPCLLILAIDSCRMST